MLAAWCLPVVRQYFRLNQGKTMSTVLRYRLRSLLVVTMIAAFCLSWYSIVELPRIALIEKITERNGRVNYLPWSLRRPFLGQRVHYVCINDESLSTDDLISDLETLLTFPSLEKIGSIDQTQILADGSTVTQSTADVYRKYLPILLDAMKKSSATTKVRSHIE